MSERKHNDAPDMNCPSSMATTSYAQTRLSACHVQVTHVSAAPPAAALRATVLEACRDVSAASMDRKVIQAPPEHVRLRQQGMMMPYTCS